MSMKYKYDLTPIYFVLKAERLFFSIVLIWDNCSMEFYQSINILLNLFLKSRFTVIKNTRKSGVHFLFDGKTD